MKKVILVAVILVAGIISANAQTEKKTVLLGGNLSFQTSDGASYFTASPNVGYFVANNLAVGARLNLFTGEGNTAWAVGPFVRGYFAGSDKGKFFAEASGNVGGADGVDTEVGFGAGAGYAIFLNKSIALELGANYTKTGSAEGIFGLGVGFQIHLKK
ncbi:MAG: hypothetical protein ABI675_22065 [Chitinophagaceae bacterium]